MGGKPVSTCLNPCSFYLSHTTKKKLEGEERERGWHSSHRSWESGHTYPSFPTNFNLFLWTCTGQIQANDVLYWENQYKTGQLQEEAVVCSRLGHSLGKENIWGGHTRISWELWPYMGKALPEVPVELLLTLRLLTAPTWMLDEICRLLGLLTLLIWHYWSSISPTVLWAKARMTACLLFACAIFMYVNDWCVCLYPSI